MKHLLLKSVSFVVCMLILTKIAFTQQSSNSVTYQLTYNSVSGLYTAWVVPNYNVPNANNSLSSEKGATAQFTLIVPKDFVIQNITDIHGVWDKAPLKLGPGQSGQSWSGYALDPNMNYYVIGKSPSETDYGSFSLGQAVSLFTFSGNSCYGPISVLDPNSIFISAADELYSLNVANSFYSRSGQPSGGNQNPLEQFSNVSGLPASCATAPLAMPDVTTATAGVLKNILILANDKNSDVTNVTDLTKVTLPVVTTSPTKGILSVNSNGSINYTPNTGATGTDTFIYSICDKINTSLCDTARVTVTISPAAPPMTDISVKKTVNKTLASQNENLTYHITVKNNGLNYASNLVVKDSLGFGLEIITSSTTRGTFNYPLLTIPTLLPGDSAIVTLVAKVKLEGVNFNYASLKSMDQVDVVTTNNSATVCTTVPITICPGEKVELSVPSLFTNVVWYKDGQQVGMGNIFMASSSGSYSTSATNISCPTSGCCPVVVIVQDCCVENLCVPLTITKIRK